MRPGDLIGQDSGVRRATHAARRRRHGRPAPHLVELRSRKERIEQAKADWKLGRFDSVPGDEKEFIPLPEERT